MRPHIFTPWLIIFLASTCTSRRSVDSYSLRIDQHYSRVAAICAEERLVARSIFNTPECQPSAELAGLARVVYSDVFDTMGNLRHHPRWIFSRSSRDRFPLVFEALISKFIPLPRPVCLSACLGAHMFEEVDSSIRAFLNQDTALYLQELAYGATHIRKLPDTPWYLRAFARATFADISGTWPPVGSLSTEQLHSFVEEFRIADGKGARRPRVNGRSRRPKRKPQRTSNAPRYEGFCVLSDVDSGRVNIPFFESAWKIGAAGIGVSSRHAEDGEMISVAELQVLRWAVFVRECREELGRRGAALAIAFSRLSSALGREHGPSDSSALALNALSAYQRADCMRKYPGILYSVDSRESS